MLEAFPYVATPIKMKPTTWEIYKYYKLLLQNKFAINSLTMQTMFNATSAFLEKLKPPHILCILIFYPKEGIASQFRDADQNPEE